MAGIPSSVLGTTRGGAKPGASSYWLVINIAVVGARKSSSTGHPVRTNLYQHYTSLASHEWQQIINGLKPLGVFDGSLLTVRHAMISEVSPNPRSLGNEAPVTGTAIYLTADPTAW
ncbi:hypothetical protein N7457_001609 [Penicillium paradoxum]|uniref:uncharacterized protein n=1 Tax=Penicillium paradoxum TaxID=176176 RepID=UPI00254813DE|nr:uncharacterized protein N7457_001609 [Penicillium paradoxum]KAJ5795010.1 hypothetical protein N7457_001609 [Penicillium paradoxum]